MNDFVRAGGVDFLDFVSLEERNLLASMCNMRKEFDLFFNLDQIFKEPLIRLKPSPNEAVIPQLYFFVHYHLFTSVACLLRVHLSEALNSSRKAIDGTLTAYYLIENPDEAEGYINGNKKFIYIKSTISRRLEESSCSFPLAKHLLELHELFSQYGSHADFSSFAHRMKIINHPDGDKEILFDYFHKPEKSDEFKYYFLSVLYSYLQMFKIFRVYFDSQFQIIDPAWERMIAELEQILPGRINALRSSQ